MLCVLKDFERVIDYDLSMPWEADNSEYQKQQLINLYWALRQ